MESIGQLIWISVRPLLRLILCVLAGFIITKLDIYPAVAARGVGQILLNITYPCLLFSKIVPAFTSDNISALGPLVLVAVTYEALGIFLAWAIKQFFWVPHRFRYGILVAGGWSNVGDVPTSVIMSITGAAPFDSSTDSTLAVAFIAAFILVFFFSLFPMGGHKLIQMDYNGPEVDDSEVRKSVLAQTKASMQGWTKGVAAVRQVTRRKLLNYNDIDVEKVSQVDDEKCSENIDPSIPCCEEQRPESSKWVSFHLRESESTAVPSEGKYTPLTSPLQTEAGLSRLPSPAPSMTRVEGESKHSHNAPNTPSVLSEKTIDIPQSVGPSTISAPRSRALYYRILAGLRTLVLTLCTPQSLSILIAFPIALITPLKALFTTVENSPIPNAPDGQPPLAFILDTANFIGAASVPMGLISLGAALARLKVPRSQWQNLPLGAISALAIGKMILMPILGVLIEEGLVHGGIIRKDQTVLRFVCIFLSCIPTATTQVFLTQVYSGTGSADILSAFLIPQYFLFFFTMVILSAYSLSLIF